MSVVVSDDEREQALHRGQSRAELPPDAEALPPATKSSTVPAAQRKLDWLTVAVWVAGLLALAGLYALGGYATTLR